MPPPGPREGTPIFFTTFLGYTFNASATVLENFKDLSVQRGWPIGSSQWNLNWRKCFGRDYSPDQNPFVMPVNDPRFEFFAAFPDHHVDRNATIIENFKDLAGRRGWSVNSSTWRRHWRNCFGRAYAKEDSLFTTGAQLDFFNAFQDYREDQDVTIVENFKRLALHRGWTVNSSTWRRHWATCFGHAYTEDENPFTNHAQSTYFADFSDYHVDRNVSILENFKRLSVTCGWGVASPMWLRQWKSCFGRDYTEPGNPFNQSDDGDSDFNDRDFSGTTPPSSGEHTAFKPNPTATLQAAFASMALHGGLKAGAQEYKDLCTDFYHDEFGRLFGRSESVLANWQNLCRIVGVDVGTSITQCKKVLNKGSVLINIVNLVNHQRAGETLRRFKSFAEFRRYTRKGHVFPKKIAKQDTFLRALLRQL